MKSGIMANVALHQGTRHFSGAVDVNQRDFCVCGRGKGRDSVRCQRCHLKHMHRGNEIDDVAAHVHVLMAKFLVWREREKKNNGRE